MAASVARNVEIVEVSPRDGLQAYPDVVSTSLKIELVRRLVRAGIRRMEVASFVNAARVPQMADAAPVMAALAGTAGCAFIGLVLNLKGLERALAAGCTEVGMVVIASDTFSRRNQGVDTDHALAAWLEIAKIARSAGVRAQLTVSAVCGCPFEGEVALSRVLDIVARAAQGEPCEIALADTIGVGVPAQVAEIFGRVRDLVPDVSLRGHFHNTRNTGLANAYAALQEGASTLDASCGGLGGCPFAPAATGNIATEDLVYMLNRCGMATDVSLQSLIETGRWLQGQLGRTLPGAVLKAGGFASHGADARSLATG
jgi:hydroxymethylglutaryl-CoA lyase